MNDPSLAGSDLPTTIPQYLGQLRAALEGADPAMVQDALYDAEEYLRSELAAQPGCSEAEVIADVAGSYGAPDEVAEIYRETEITVNRALRRWTALGATLGGRVWLDPALNTAESLSAGLVYIHYDGEAPAPMEHIVFVFNRNTGYYDTVLASAAREIARQSALAAA